MKFGIQHRGLSMFTQAWSFDEAYLSQHENVHCPCPMFSTSPKALSQL